MDEQSVPIVAEDIVMHKLSAIVQRASGSFESIEDFQSFIRTYIRPILPHEALICGIGLFTFEQLDIKMLIPVDYPKANLEQISTKVSLEERPAIAEWLRRRKPLLLDLESDSDLLSDLEKCEFERFKLGKIAIHGQTDISGRMTSYFSFSQVKPNQADYENILELLIPHLHLALLKTYRSWQRSNENISLTSKEIEILKWISLGRSNKEIAEILSKSAMTIRNQVHHLLGKLEAANRSEAIVRADEMGLLSPESHRSNDPSN